MTDLLIKNPQFYDTFDSDIFLLFVIFNDFNMEKNQRLLLFSMTTKTREQFLLNQTTSSLMALKKNEIKYAMKAIKTLTCDRFLLFHCLACDFILSSLKSSEIKFSYSNFGNLQTLIVNKLLCQPMKTVSKKKKRKKT